MTGDLNMGGNDVNNVKNLTASGSVSSGALKSSGDTTVGGNLTVAGTSTLSGNARVLSRLATSGYSPDDLPSGWGGGIRTLDAYASGSIGAGTNGDVNTYLNSAGYIYAAIDANVGRQVNTQYVWATGNVNSNYVHSNGNIDANGRVNAGEFVYINGQSQPGWGCSPNGLQGRTPEGTLLSCVNGVWKSAGLGSVYIIQGNQACGQYATSNATCPGKLVSGGYYLSRWGGDGWNTPDNNFPSSAWTWTTFNGGGIRPGTCITAFALCTN
ncbi:hypothetical protein BTJ39_09080 [Izhakiella australiensis]|uniref:Bacterial shufflon protein N-terminal domain-containing protein n=1 Tax=Izhakiella australiensis TaxID=1926881 RepID=A0A1S8YNC5_9GAMM|nr:hypothetical protein BTJ39_09080 [Izhakiella australiensis]